MGNYTIFRCSKILGEAGKQEILQQYFENSRSQIVFRTDIFRKLTLDAPRTCTLHAVALMKISLNFVKIRQDAEN